MTQKFKKLTNQLKQHTLVRYLLVGGTSYVLEISCLLFIYYVLDTNKSVATAIAYLVGFTIAFVLQKTVAFQDYRKELGVLSKQTALYVALNLWNYAFTIAIVSIIDGKYILLSRTFALILMISWNYLIYKNVLFAQNSKETTKSQSSFFSWIRNNLTIVASFSLLTLASLYSAFHANLLMIYNSDNLVYPYLFKSLQLHDIVLPAHHPNILKFPLFWLQSVVPYNVTTFSIVSIGLVVATVLIWCLLLLRLFGKRYSIFICFPLAFILLSSNPLNRNILGTTIRNIEYPVALAFLFVINALLIKGFRSFNHWKVTVSIIVSILYVMSVAGDSLLLYAFSLPIILIILFYWLQSGILTKRIMNVTLFIVIVNLAAVLLKNAVATAGIAILYKDPVFSSRTLPLEALGPSISTTGKQLLQLHGANIFDKPLSIGSLPSFINFFVLGLAIIGFVLLLFRLSKAFRRREDLAVNHSLILGTLALSFFGILATYILSGQAIRIMQNGDIISANQERYLTLIPFLTTVGFVYLIKEYYGWHTFLIKALAPTAMLVVLLLSLPTIRIEQNKTNIAAANWKTSVEQAVNITLPNDISVVVTGYWYGSPLRFQSGDKLKFASIAACNVPQPPFNNRKSWYKPQAEVINSAFVIDRTGPDKTYWEGCSDDQLISIFGKPKKISKVPGLSSGSRQAIEGVHIWIYDYDLRQKFVPYPDIF